MGSSRPLCCFLLLGSPHIFCQAVVFSLGDLDFIDRRVQAYAYTGITGPSFIK